MKKVEYNGIKVVFSYLPRVFEFEDGEVIFLSFFIC